MKAYLSWTSIGILVSGLLASCPAWAQTGARGAAQPSFGNPTALPPGGANTPTAGTARPAGRAGTAQPAGRAGTADPAGTAGTASPAGRAGTARPATRLGVDPPRGVIGRSVFGGNPGMLDVGPSTGESFGRSPASALPGRPNFNQGSTSATFRPSGPIAGGPNTPANARAFAEQNRAITAPLSDNRVFIDPATANILSNFNAPVLGQTVPSGFGVPVPVPESPTPDFDTVAPNNNPLTITLPPAGGTEASRRTFARGNGRVQLQISAEGSATATAFPAREPADARTTVTQPRDGTSGNRTADFVEVQAGGGTPVKANFRGSTDTTAQRPARPSVYPGYTVWQGYYWYHSPASGWHYWDGGRWSRFADADGAQ